MGRSGLVLGQVVENPGFSVTINRTLNHGLKKKEWFTQIQHNRKKLVLQNKYANEQTSNTENAYTVYVILNVFRRKL